MQYSQDNRPEVDSDVYLAGYSGARRVVFIERDMAWITTPQKPPHYLDLLGPVNRLFDNQDEALQRGCKCDRTWHPDFEHKAECIYA